MEERRPPIAPTINQTLQSFPLSIHPSTHPSIRPSIPPYLSIHPPTHPSGRTGRNEEREEDGVGGGARRQNVGRQDAQGPEWAAFQGVDQGEEGPKDLDARPDDDLGEAEAVEDHEEGEEGGEEAVAEEGEEVEREGHAEGGLAGGGDGLGPAVPLEDLGYLCVCLCGCVWICGLESRGAFRALGVVRLGGWVNWLVN
jgi:hypothetical protein